MGHTPTLIQLVFGVLLALPGCVDEAPPGPTDIDNAVGQTGTDSSTVGQTAPDDTVGLTASDDTIGQTVTGNTVEVFLKENEPVKLIVVAETVVIGGSEPLVEVAGRPDPLTGQKGDIRICSLILKDVDADRLEVRDTEVVRVDTFDVVAQDNELDVQALPVDVVRCDRGGTTVLAVGIAREDVDIGNRGPNVATDLEALLAILGKDRESGAKVDRIRVLGPEGKTGLVENLIVLRSSVFGRIQVRDVKVDTITLNNVSLDDFVPFP